ncbi:MAG: hemin receptor, partial [Gammaproteobacteria bacterium]|nr:hemin receptor [Gammaproteobacteria bacterium]
IARQVKPMFSNTNMKSQGQKLMTTLSVAVNGLSDFQSIVPKVQKLGVTHIKYGVKESHFPIVADALLWTLEQGLGDDWNEDVKDAWVAAYTLLAKTMIDAMNAETAKQEAEYLNF